MSKQYDESNNSISTNSSDNIINTSLLSKRKNKLYKSNKNNSPKKKQCIDTIKNDNDDEDLVKILKISNIDMLLQNTEDIDIKYKYINQGMDIINENNNNLLIINNGLQPFSFSLSKEDKLVEDLLKNNNEIYSICKLGPCIITALNNKIGIISRDEQIPSKLIDCSYYPEFSCIRKMIPVVNTVYACTKNSLWILLFNNGDFTHKIKYMTKSDVNWIDMALTPDYRSIYILDNYNECVIEYDIITKKILHTIEGFSNPCGLSLCKINNELWVIVSATDSKRLFFYNRNTQERKYIPIKDFNPTRLLYNNNTLYCISQIPDDDNNNFKAIISQNNNPNVIYQDYNFNFENDDIQNDYKLLLQQVEEQFPKTFAKNIISNTPEAKAFIKILKYILANTNIRYEKTFINVVYLFERIRIILETEKVPENLKQTQQVVIQTLKPYHIQYKDT